MVLVWVDRVYVGPRLNGRQFSGEIELIFFSPFIIYLFFSALVVELASMMLNCDVYSLYIQSKLSGEIIGDSNNLYNKYLFF